MANKSQIDWIFLQNFVFLFGARINNAQIKVIKYSQNTRCYRFTCQMNATTIQLIGVCPWIRCFLFKCFFVVQCKPIFWIHFQQITSMFCNNYNNYFQIRNICKTNTFHQMKTKHTIDLLPVEGIEVVDRSRKINDAFVVNFNKIIT